MKAPTPLWMDGPAGPLFAMHHTAERVIERKACIVMISGGTAVRFGPQRLYVKAARYWSLLGFDVLRVDVAGIGDAQAASDATSLDCHSAGDVEAAVGYARTRLGAQDVILLGLRGGGRVVARHAVTDPALTAVALWNTPVITVGYVGGMKLPGADAHRMSSARAKQNLERLRAALFELHFLRPTWWRWVLRNARTFTHELGYSLQHHLRPEHSQRSHFVEALAVLLARGTPLLNVYGSLEQVAIDELGQALPQLGRRLRDAQTLQIVDGGNHTFNTLAAEASAISLTGQWMLGVIGVSGETWHIAPPDEAAGSAPRVA